MKRFLLAVLLACATVVQMAWLPFVRPFGVVPDLVLVMLVLVALEETAITSLVAAVLCGLALDLASGARFGIWTGTLVLEVLAAALIRRSGVETVGWLVPVAMVSAGTLVMAALVLGSLLGVVGGWPAGNLIVRVGGEILVNLGLMWISRPVVRRCVKLGPGGEIG